MARTLFARVILRPDDVTEFLSIYWKDNKNEPLAKQVKRWLGDSFRKFDEYQLAKYNGGQKAVKLRDALADYRPEAGSRGPVAELVARKLRFGSRASWPRRTPGKWSFPRGVIRRLRGRGCSPKRNSADSPCFAMFET